MEYNINVKASGPIFDGKAPAVITKAGEDTVTEAVELGMEHLGELLRPRPSGVYLSVAEAQKGHASTGNYRRNLHDVVQSLHGRIDDSSVVYGPWLEGVSSRNESTRFKGYASFRRTKDWLEARMPAILKKNIDRAIAKLNGSA